MPRFWFATDRSEGRRQVVAADSLPQALLDLKHEGVAVQSGGLAPPGDLAPENESRSNVSI